MGFNPPVPQQDSNWEIRVAVLLSLGLQVLLIFGGPERKRVNASTYRVGMWSCYLLADWVADLALGLILNNMGNIGGSSSASSSSSSFGGMKRGGATAGNADDSSPMIFAFWTPFLLLHLGGPDTITAYSLEDNELWRRHLIGLLFELFSASVIFFCTLRGNPMIHATVLVFAAGIIKYGERTWSLYSGSLERFRGNILGPPHPGLDYATEELDDSKKKKASFSIAVGSSGGSSHSQAAAAAEVEEDVDVQQQQRTDDEEITMMMSTEARAFKFLGVFRRLFVDLTLSSKQRRMSRAFFLRNDVGPGEAYEIVETELNFIYDLLYTKAPVAHTKGGWVLRCVCSGCLAGALAIFFALDKRRHNIQRADVGITYALLLGGLALDAEALLLLLVSDRAIVYLEQESHKRPMRWLLRLARAAQQLPQRPRRWSRTAAMVNLIVDCNFWERLIPSFIRPWIPEVHIVRPPVRRPLDKIKYYKKKRSPTSSGSQGEEVVPRQEATYCLTITKEGFSQAYIESHLLKTLFHRVKDAASQLGSKDDDDLLETDKAFNYRGSRVLDKYEREIRQLPDGGDKFNMIMDSVATADFDESLLLWHVATDLCRCPRRLRDEEVRRPMTMSTRWLVGETLSGYMLYLLVRQPEMLSARTGIWMMRYQDTCAEAQRFIRSYRSRIREDEDARMMLLRMNTSQKPSAVKGGDESSKSVLFDAVILAKALRELDQDLMWELVAEVWMEMLLYAARRCPGSTHARQLSRGGELITVIWLLMEHMGLGNAMPETNKERRALAKLIVHDH